MNYYKEIANVLGLQLLDEFKCLGSETIYRITNAGLQEYVPSSADGWKNSYLYKLHAMLKGEMLIIKQKRKHEFEYAVYLPKTNDKYYKCMIETRCGKTTNTVVFMVWKDRYEDYLNYAIGNCFRTEEEAALKGAKIVEKLISEIIDRSL